MGRKVDEDDLVGTAKIAECPGVKGSQLIHARRSRNPEFREPVVKVVATLT